MQLAARATLLLACGVAFHAAPAYSAAAPNDEGETASLGQARPWASQAAFTNAVLKAPETVRLPVVDRWTITVEDLLQPGSLTMDLALHKKTPFKEVWQLLSPETQQQLTEKRASLLRPHSGGYNPGPELDALVADLNRLLEERLLFGGKPLAGVRPSGDTLQLLALKPEGALVTRLNRLILEDTLPLDILRRPKVLTNPVSHKYLLVDFKKGPRPFSDTTTAVLTLYDDHGTMLWSVDLTPSIEAKARSYGYSRMPSVVASGANIGVWDIQFRRERIAVQLMGREAVGFDMNTGSAGAPYRW